MGDPIGLTLSHVIKITYFTNSDRLMSSLLHQNVFRVECAEGKVGNVNPFIHPSILGVDSPTSTDKLAGRCLLSVISLHHLIYGIQIITYSVYSKLSGISFSDLEGNDLSVKPICHVSKKKFLYPISILITIKVLLQHYIKYVFISDLKKKTLKLLALNKLTLDGRGWAGGRQRSIMGRVKDLLIKTYETLSACCPLKNLVTVAAHNMAAYPRGKLLVLLSVM